MFSILVECTLFHQDLARNNSPSPRNIIEYYVGLIERIMAFPCRQITRDLVRQVGQGGVDLLLMALPVEVGPRNMALRFRCGAPRCQFSRTDFPRNETS
jgi:hypothetical protein